MGLNSWKIVIQESPHLKDVDSWPQVNIEHLSENNKKKFIRDRYRIRLVLTGKHLDEVAKVTGCSKSTISKRLNRCLASTAGKEPALNYGLLPNKKIAKIKSPSEILKKKGIRYSFTALIENTEGLEKYLDDKIKGFVKRQSDALNLCPKTFHSYLLKYLIENNHPSDHYPFNETTFGYESSRRYYHKRLLHIESQIYSSRKAIDASLKRIKKIDVNFLEEIEFDSHLIDCTSKFEFTSSFNIHSVRIPRLWLLVAIDRASKAIISYCISFGEKVSSNDISELLFNLHKPWKRLTSDVIELPYTKKSGIPSGLYSKTLPDYP